MNVYEREILIIGAGPAGLSAAIEAKRVGADVLVVDENSVPGGQLYKQIHKFFGSAEHRAGKRGFEIAKAMCDEADSLGVEFWLNTVAYGIFKDGVGIVRDGGNCLIKAKTVIVAAGSSEDPVAFPGSTLPGIITAGAAQTMANVHRVLPGKHIVILGSGNVGLILAYQLMQAGADVEAVVEKADHIGGYGVHAAKLRRAGVPIMTGMTVKEVHGTESVEEVIIAQLDPSGSFIDGTEHSIKADTLCIAAGMSPLTELLWQAGAKFDYIATLGGFVPLHDECMKTTLGYVYAAGDVTGVEEAPIAMEEGIIAGISAAEAVGRMSTDEAETVRSAARERISALESGAFGESRKAARHMQIVDMCSGKGGK